MAEVCPDAEETGRHLRDHHREKRETEVRGRGLGWHRGVVIET